MLVTSNVSILFYLGQQNLQRQCFGEPITNGLLSETNFDPDEHILPNKRFPSHESEHQFHYHASGEVLRMFCDTDQKSEVSDESTIQIRNALKISVLWCPNCEKQLNKCLKVVTRWECDQGCSNMGRSGSNTLCLVLLGSMKAVLEFRSVTDVLRNARDNVLVTAPYFPPHEYRPRLHIISPLLGFIGIFRGIPDKSATSSNVKRTNMLLFSAFRQFTPSSSSSVGEEDQYLFGKFKHNMEDSVGSWLLQLHSNDNPMAYEECWSYPHLSQIYDDNSSESSGLYR